MNDVHKEIRKVDSENQLDAVFALPDHLRDALWRIESARLRSMEAPAAFVCGMGGSAIGGDLAAAALGDRLTKPLLTARGYELPSWAFAGSAVLCSSYSGNTEETLACYSAAEALGAQRLVATTGGKLADLARADGVPVVGLPAGLQPRAAVGYMFTVAAELAALSLAAPRINTEIDAAAAHLERRRNEIAAQAAELAGRVADSTLVVHGSGLTSAVAYRWACQVNENAKVPAYAWDMPEANHNELVGWEGASERGPFACLLLTDVDHHPRERQRMELTAELAAPGASEVVSIEAQGETRTARMLELVMLGDLLSLHMAAARGVEPSSVEIIDTLKARLGD
jgi:glucose/mannose-6-phosphate isomerase